MNNQLKIAAIIPTFNGLSRGYLGAALDSVFQQSHPIDEVIFVDDGSTDGTADFVRSHFPSVTVLTKQNHGLPAARNTGVLAAKSQLIAFLDDDDVWYVEKTEEQLKLLLNSNCEIDEAIVVAPYRELQKQDEVWRLTSICYPSRCWLTWPGCVLGNGVTSPSGTLISRSIILKVGRFDPSLSIGEDYEFWMRLCINQVKFLTCKLPLVQYRKHSVQMSGNFEKVFNSVYKIQSYYINFLPLNQQLRAKSFIRAHYVILALRFKLFSLLKRLYIMIMHTFITENRKSLGWVAVFCAIELVRGCSKALGFNRLSIAIRSFGVFLCFRMAGGEISNREQLAVAEKIKR